MRLQSLISKLRAILFGFARQNISSLLYSTAKNDKIATKTSESGIKRAALHKKTKQNNAHKNVNVSSVISDCVATSHN